MFNNPLSYAGYPPGVTGKANNTNTTVRAATLSEATGGTKDNVYLSPLTGSTFSAPSVSGATPIVNNSRKGQVSFTNAVASTSYFTYTMTNSLITAASVIMAIATCGTTTSAVFISNITPGAGTVAFRVYNAGAASSSGNNVVINYEIFN